MNRQAYYQPPYFSRSEPSPSQSANRLRLWEVDAIRGIAIVMMVIYHFVYDLYYFGISDTIFTDPFWFYFQRTTATLFIGIVGVSLALRRHQGGENVRFARLARRGGTIFLWGVLISVMTWIALGPAMYIRFGILHFIGLAIVLAYPFMGLRWMNLALGVVLIGIGIWLQQFTFQAPWTYLFWLGLEPANHMYVDFFPFIRWFGVVLIGIFFGNLLYSAHGREFSWPFQSSPMVEAHVVAHGLIQLGRRSLPIYLLHQPVLLALFALFLLLVNGLA